MITNEKMLMKNKNKNDQDDSFFTKYPNMRSLLKINNQELNKGDFERISGVGTRSFLSMFVYLLLLLFTILLLSLRVDIELSFYCKDSIYWLFADNFVVLFDTEAVYDFLKSTVGPALLVDDTSSLDESSYVLNLSKYIGPIYIRQVRSKKVSCAKTWSDSPDSCYDIAYDSSTKETGQICTGYSWCTYKSESETGISRNIYGRYSTYDGDGYVVEFDSSKKVSEWNTMIDNLKLTNFIDTPTRGIFVEFNIYNPSDDIWVATEIVIEFTTLYISPSFISIQAFDASLFETSSEKGLRAVGFLRFFLSLYIAVFLIGYKIYKIKNWRLLISFKYFEKLFIDTLILLTIFVNLILENNTFDISTESYVNSAKFKDIMEMGVIFNNVMILDSIILLMLTVKIISIFTILKSVRIIMKVIAISFKQIVAYILVLMPLIISFSIIGVGIYGPYSDYYRTFEESYISVLFLFIGQCNVAELMKINSFWTVIYVICVSIITIYLVLSSFMAVYYDALETVVLQNGYPGDETDKKWTVKEAIGWVIDFLPNRILKKINIFAKENKNEDEDEEKDDNIGDIPDEEEKEETKK